MAWYRAGGAACVGFALLLLVVDTSRAACCCGVKDGAFGGMTTVNCASAGKG
jgi:hypothetical protein